MVWSQSSKSARHFLRSEGVFGFSQARKGLVPVEVALAPKEHSVSGEYETRTPPIYFFSLATNFLISNFAPFFSYHVLIVSFHKLL